MKKFWLPILSVGIVCLVIGVLFVFSIQKYYTHITTGHNSQSGAEQSVSIPNMSNEHAALQQNGNLTILDLTTENGTIQHIPLSHPSDYLQGSDAPYESKLIAENPGHYLIFTDTFTSNTDPQGECGASETGERFLHVVALGALPHETLSTLVDSCLLNIESAPNSPLWTTTKDSSGYIGNVTIVFEADDSIPPVLYYVGPDGDVSRPTSK